MTRARSAPVPTGRGCQNAYGHLFSQLQSISKAGVGKTEVALCPVFAQPGSHGQPPRKGALLMEPRPRGCGGSRVPRDRSHAWALVGTDRAGSSRPSRGWPPSPGTARWPTPPAFLRRTGGGPPLPAPPRSCTEDRPRDRRRLAQDPAAGSSPGSLPVALSESR